VTTAESDAEVPVPLPEPIRARVVALVADALPQVAPLPAALRKVAAFAPRRRARLGGAQIVAALADSEFRERVAMQVDAARPARTDDPVDDAAYAWLLRPEDWEDRVADAVRQVATAGPPPDVAEVDRLRERLAAAEQSVKDLRTAHKAALEELKAENSALRRKLGEARAAARKTAAEFADAIAVAEQGRSRASSALQAAEAESRRLRGQVEELQTAVTAARREARSGRDDATLRARILLETLIDAGQGLRRELALPAVSGTPGEKVEEGYVAGQRDPSSAGALGPDSPVLLEQYLSMPRARLIIDGYNVSKAAWPESSLEAQRIRLVNGVASLVARVGAETTVVFDAAAVSARPVTTAPRGVKVMFSPEGVIADDVIRDLVAAEPEGRVVVVVSSDAEVARDILRAGARSMSASSLVALANLR
jgi:predicted RNA-binding protein with PIN domain